MCALGVSDCDGAMRFEKKKDSGLQPHSNTTLQFTVTRQGICSVFSTRQHCLQPAVCKAAPSKHSKPSQHYRRGRTKKCSRFKTSSLSSIPRYYVDEYSPIFVSNPIMAFPEQDTMSWNRVINRQSGTTAREGAFMIPRPKSYSSDRRDLTRISYSLGSRSLDSY